MLQLQSGAVLSVMRRRLRQAFENETVFTIGVIGFGILPIAMLLALLAVR
jgi:hypothetical protein